MPGAAAAIQDEAQVRACTVSRDVQNFDLLIEDMETEYGEAWGDLNFVQGLQYLDQPAAESLEMLAIALDDADEPNLPQIKALIQRACEMNIRVLLIAEALSPILLHQLLRLGADDFVPYPLPEGALHEAIERLQAPPPEFMQPAQATGGGGGKQGAVLGIQALAGGVGATTLAVNLGWELSKLTEDSDLKVCILDFDLQGGSVSTYLDLARTERVYELLSSTATMDRDAFHQTLQKANDRLSVLTAPADMLPLDLLGPEEIGRVVNMARSNFDFVIVDMPRSIVQWTETVMSASTIYFALLDLDMRSAQNALRLIRALKADDLPVEKLRFALSRAPKFTDLSGKSRAKRMAESLGISIGVNLPDGGTQVREANDHGLPLAEFAAKNPLLKEIRKLAESLHQIEASATAGAD